MQMDASSDRPSDPASDPAPAPTPMVDSRSLLGDGRELKIRHDGEIYRLRLTRNGKLILNK